MDIIQENTSKKGAFKAIQNSIEAGVMSYTWAGDDKFIIDSTHVDEAFGGQGVGKKLLQKVIEFAREQQVKIIPLCPFAKAAFDKDPSLADVKA